jgi:hypothetical protein
VFKLFFSFFLKEMVGGAIKKLGDLLLNEPTAVGLSDSDPSLAAGRGSGLVPAIQSGTSTNASSTLLVLPPPPPTTPRLSASLKQVL